MAGVFVRRALVALAAACACAVTAAPAHAAVPTNDTWQAAHELVPANPIGNRNIPFYSDASGASAPVREIDVTDATSSPDDPILQTGFDVSTCNEIPTAGTRTVFYRFTLSERTALTIDTLGSTASYATVLALYQGSVSAATLVACASGNLVGSQSALDFVTRAGATYYLEVAGSTNQAGPARLNLFIRATDVQPPRVTITANQALAEPGNATVFGLVEPRDDGSGLAEPRTPPVWKVTFDPDIGDPIELEATPVAGSDGNEVRVRWPRGFKLVGWGQAVVTLVDQAGNIGTNSLRMRVRDRTPPRVKSIGFRVDHRRNRVWAWIRCTEAGRASINLLGPRRGSSPGNVRAGSRRMVAFRNRAPGGYLLVYRCRDSSGNSSATRVSRPFVLR